MRTPPLLHSTLAAFLVMGAGGFNVSQTIVPQLFPPRAANPFVVRAGFDGISFTSARNPDPYIAVGPSSIVLVVNWSIGIRDKSGRVIAESSLDRFFDGAPVSNTGGFDARSYFDASSGRFFIASTDAGTQTNPCTASQCPAYLLIAVSRTSNPRTLTGTDWLFSATDGSMTAPAGAPAHAAEPVVGFTSDTVAVALGMSGIVSGHGHGGLIRIFPKQALLANSPVTPVDLPPDPSSLLIPTSTFAPGPVPVASVRYPVPRNCDVMFWMIETPLSAPRLSPQIVAGTGSCVEPPKPQQPGAALPIDELAAILYHGGAFYRNGRVWLAHPVASTANPSVAEIRWGELDVSTWPGTVRMTQDARLTDSSRSFFYPGIAADEKNNVLLVFAVSGTSEFPSIYFTGRLSTDLRNTLRPVRLLKAGNAALDNPETLGRHAGQNRYGGAFSVALDPIDGSFWVVGEYMKTRAEWATWVSNIVVP